jgi:hypothetical protein
MGESYFEHSQQLQLKDGIYRATNGKEINGNWKIRREPELIYNPLIQFFIDQQLIEEAMITRLFFEKEEDALIYRLTIYFSTGLELVLSKTGR